MNIHDETPVKLPWHHVILTLYLVSSKRKNYNMYRGRSQLHAYISFALAKFMNSMIMFDTIRSRNIRILLVWISNLAVMNEYWLIFIANRYHMLSSSERLCIPISSHVSCKNELRHDHIDELIYVMLSKKLWTLNKIEIQLFELFVARSSHNNDSRCLKRSSCSRIH